MNTKRAGIGILDCLERQKGRDNFSQSIISKLNKILKIIIIKKKKYNPKDTTLCDFEILHYHNQNTTVSPEACNIYERTLTGVWSLGPFFCDSKKVIPDVTFHFSIEKEDEPSLYHIHRKQEGIRKLSKCRPDKGGSQGV